MASVVASPLSSVLVPRTPVSSSRAFHNFPLFPLPERKRCAAITVKAVGGSSESSSSLSIVKSVQNLWDDSEDRFAVIGVGFAAVVALWASVNLVSAVDKLPLIPGVLELVGILYSSWFVYRYLLFKPAREEFFRDVNKTISDVLGQ